MRRRLVTPRQGCSSGGGKPKHPWRLTNQAVELAWRPRWWNRQAQPTHRRKAELATEAQHLVGGHALNPQQRPAGGGRVPLTLGHRLEHFASRPPAPDGVAVGGKHGNIERGKQAEFVELARKLRPYSEGMAGQIGGRLWRLRWNRRLDAMAQPTFAGTTLD